MPNVKKALLALTLGHALILANQAAAQPARKLALVIGISGYDDRIGRLPSAANDAQSIEKALKAIDFQVTTLLDPSRDEWNSGIGKFSSSITRGDVVLVYYAGHGVQVNGANYLLPADFLAGSDPTTKGIRLDDLIQRVSARSPRLKIFVIDACRNNPFTKGLKSGLADINAVDYGSGTYIAMAASPGQLATDGLFAKHFVAVLGMRGLEVREVFTEVRKRVVRDSGNREVPFGADLISENYILAPTNPKMPLERIRMFETGVVHLAALSPDGELLALTGDGGSVQLWNIESGTSVGPLTGPEKTPHSIQFSPDSKLLAAGGERAVWLWDTATKQARKLEDRGMGTVLSSSFAADGQYLVSSGSDKKARIWNIATGQLESWVKLDAPADWSAFVPDPKLSAVFLLGGTARQPLSEEWIWRSKHTAPLLAFNFVNILAFAPDGRKVAGGTRDGAIQSWDLGDIEHPRKSKVFANDDAVVAMAFTADGRRLVSVGEDKLFRWWDTETAKVLRAMEAPPDTERILALSFIANGRLLAVTASVADASNGRRSGPVRASEVEILNVPSP